METAECHENYSNYILLLMAVVRLAHRDAVSPRKVHMCNEDEKMMWHRSAKRFLAEWQADDRKIPLGKQVFAKGLDRW